jgi:C4-dicarboxylate-specific signal transduction histidine kinase
MGKGPKDLQRRNKELQELIADLQRQTDLRETVSALVHEATQPLTAISSYVAACRRLVKTGEHEKVECALAQIADQTNRAWEIVQKVREVVK